MEVTMRIVHPVIVGLVSCLGWLGLPSIGHAQPKFSAIHGTTDAKFAQWIDGLVKQKLRPSFVSVAELKGTPTYAAVAVENKFGDTWAARRDLSHDEYQKEFLAQNAKGLRPISVACYRKGDALNYAAVFLKDNTPQWIARHGMDAVKNQQEFDTLTRQGYRPVQGTSCEGKDGVHFSYLFIKDGLRDWLSQSGLTADQYQKLVDDSAKKGSYPISAWAYATKNGTRFAAIVAEDPQKRSWSSKHHLTPKQYEEHFKNMTDKGFLPAQICAYPWEGEARYLAVFVKE
jgi:Bacterial tandem repeat domain 1